MPVQRFEPWVAHPRPWSGTRTSPPAAVIPKACDFLFRLCYSSVPAPPRLAKPLITLAFYKGLHIAPPPLQGFTELVETRQLERDDFSSNRHPALPLCLSMSFFAKPVPTFAGHALGLAKSAVKRALERGIEPGIPGQAFEPWC